MDDFDEYLVAGEPDKRERAYGWATAIGLQDGDGLKVSDFLLNTAKRNIEGEITQVEEKSREGNLSGYIGYSEIDAMSNQMEKEKR